MLVRAVGGGPLWKERAVLCILGSLAPVWGDFKVCGGSVAGYPVINRVGRDEETRVVEVGGKETRGEYGIVTFA